MIPYTLEVRLEFSGGGGRLVTNSHERTGYLLCNRLQILAVSPTNRDRVLVELLSNLS